MRLRQLQLHNYRSFGDAIVDLEDVTLFTGPNNAGKSMLLDAVRCLFSGPEQHRNWGWRDLAQRRRVHMPGQDEDGVFAFDDSYVDAYEPVWIIGVFDRLQEEERLRYGRYLVCGCLQLGMYISRESDENDPEESRYFVLPEGHESAAGPESRMEGGEPVLLPERQEIWRPYLEDLDVFLEPPFPIIVDFPGPDRPVPSARDLLRPFLERKVDGLVASLPARLDELMEQLAGRIVHELGVKLNDVVPAYLSDSARLAVKLGHRPRLHGALLASLGGLEVHVSLGNGVVPEPWDPTENELPPGRGGQKPRFGHAARPQYSWIRPPSRSFRRTSRGLTVIGTSFFARGVARPRARCGRPRL